MELYSIKYHIKGQMLKKESPFLLLGFNVSEKRGEDSDPALFENACSLVLERIEENEQV